MSIKQWIRNWLMGDGVKLKGAVIREDTAYPNAEGTGISISEAINGKVLTLRTFQPNRAARNVHSDWVTEYYVIKDGESLTEALTMLLVIRGIDK